MSLGLNLNGIDTTATDRVGGQGYSLPTDVYDAEIVLAYLISSSSSKSRGLDITLKINNEEKSFQVYYTNKNNELFYLDKNKNKRALPGLLLLSALTQLTIGKPFNDLSSSDMSKKTIKAWDSNAKAELPKEVDIIHVLNGKKVKVAIEQIEQNKYSDASKTEKKNNLIKFFNEKGYTSTEVDNLKSDPTLQPEFINKWVEAYKDKITDKVDKSKINTATSTGSKSVIELTIDDEDL